MAVKTVCDACDKTIPSSKLIELSNTGIATGNKNVFHFCSWDCVEKYAKAKKKEMK